jgi:hypothetical protein
MMYAGVVISVCNEITADGKYFTNFYVQTVRDTILYDFDLN